jgi:dTDP-4-dehydrorhamnose 3,5-epimerase-like enzyme
MNGVETTIHDCHIIQLRTILRDEGKLTIIQNEKFDLKRVYYIYDVPEKAERGHHAHKTLHQLIVAISGSFHVKLDDGIRVWNVTLRDPKKGLLVKPGIWRELSNFSKGAICLVMASELYNEEDYIRNYYNFLEFKNV